MVSQTMVNALRRVISMMVQKEYKEQEEELKEEKEVLRGRVKDYVVNNLINRKAVVFDAVTNEDGTVTVTILPIDSEDYQKYTELLDRERDLRLRYHELLEKLEIWYGLTMARKDDLVDPPELPDDLKAFIAKAQLLLEE